MNRLTQITLAIIFLALTVSMVQAEVKPMINVFNCTISEPPPNYIRSSSTNLIVNNCKLIITGDAIKDLLKQIESRIQENPELYFLMLKNVLIHNINN
jgi:hypothetical protein